MVDEKIEPAQAYIPYLFGDSVQANTVAAKFFHRWLMLNRMGWSREKCFATLMEDPGLTVEWREFAENAYEALMKPKRVNPKETRGNIQDDQHAALYALFHASPLLTTYVRHVLMDGSINEALETLLTVYRFENNLPEVST